MSIKESSKNNARKARVKSSSSCAHGKLGPRPDNGLDRLGYRAFFDKLLLPALIWEQVYDKDGRVVDEKLLDGNNVALAILRASGLRTVKGARASKIAPKDYRALLPLILQLKSTEDPVAIERHMEITGRDYLTSVFIIDDDVIGTTYQDITENKVGRAALEDAKRQFQILFHNANDGVTLIDRRGKILASNIVAGKKLGYDPIELSKMHWKQIIIPEDWSRMNSFLDEAKDGDSRLIKTTLSASTSLRIPVEIKCLTFTSEEQLVNLLIADDNVRLEMNYGQGPNANHLNEMVEAIPEMVWEIDYNGIIKYINPASNKVLGYTSNEIIGLSIDDLYTFDKGIMKERFRRCLHEYRPFERIERRAVRSNGDWVILESSGMPLFDRSGMFTGYSGMDRDITRSKRVTDLLREKNRFFYKGVNQLPVGIYYVLIPSNDILLVNHHFCRVWGIEKAEEQIRKKELNNNDVLRLLSEHVDNKNEFVLSWLSLFRGRKYETVNEAVELTDGKLLELLSAPVFDGKKKLIGRVFIVKEMNDASSQPNQSN